MKIKNIIDYIKKRWWHLLLLVSSSYYVITHWNNINQFKDFDTTNFIFILWVILLLLPLFSEMEIFGVKLKKEILATKTEVKEGLNNLRLQIMELKINNSTTLNFGNGFLPTEEKMKELIAEYFQKKDNVSSDKLQHSDKENTKIAEDAIPDESTYLFKTRLMLEKNITSLCDKTDYRGNHSIVEMITHLISCEIIDGTTADLINQIVKITNRGVHGEIISKQYIEFIKKVMPDLQKQLLDLNKQLHYFICPRCKHSGYSRYKNVCPNCGLTICDE